MSAQRSIEVSTAVFAKIWSLHRDGEESEDQILARILGVSVDNREKSGLGATLQKKLWRHDVQTALRNLGGEALLDAIYDETRNIRLRDGRSLPVNFKAIVRKELEHNSSDSDAFKGKYDWFISVDGIGAGRWALRQGARQE